MKRASDPRDNQIHAVFGLPAPTFGLGVIPPHSPYQAGDWVAYHAYSGTRPPDTRHGFRGYVLGSMGATLLRGLTDDGLPWCEHWGHLVPDGQRDRSAAIDCICCPPPPRAPRRPRTGRDVEQLDLFGALELIGGAA
jgi:hypothetical protein